MTTTAWRQLETEAQQAAQKAKREPAPRCIDGTLAHHMRYESPNGGNVTGICTRGCGRIHNAPAAGGEYYDRNEDGRTNFTIGGLSGRVPQGHYTDTRWG